MFWKDNRKQKYKYSTITIFFKNKCPAKKLNLMLFGNNGFLLAFISLSWNFANKTLS